MKRRRPSYVALAFFLEALACNPPPADQNKISLYMNFEMVGAPIHVFFAHDGDDSDAVGAEPNPGGSAELESTFERSLNSIGALIKGTVFSGRVVGHLIPWAGCHLSSRALPLKMIK